jgi:uncharacterized YigZ family protein
MNEYKSVKLTSEGFYKEKGSKFIAYAYHVSNETEIKEIIEKLWKDNHGACHVCFAWRLSNNNHTRYSDDGEPSNSAGKPIFGQIESYDLYNTLIAVVRFYGGTNLGVGGLIQAYKTSSKEALENAEIITHYPSEVKTIKAEISKQPFIMQAIKKYEAKVVDENYDSMLNICYTVAIKDSSRLQSELTSLGVIFI